ncbi:hypothetical protein MYX84_01350 [Acidobacteria bacterium AH-259-O06]|nr:hypothetical protein [Acidobacteria bacterium AH-259-O06]
MSSPARGAGRATGKATAQEVQEPEPQEAKRHTYYEFSEDGRECIIKRPDTPMPWMNLLSNDVFQAWITHRGYHECYMLDRSLNGLTNPQEVSGHIYIKDSSTGQFFMLNRPRKGAFWEASHGLGYTTVRTSDLSLSVEVTYFVPRDDHALIWLITVQNHLPRERQIDLFSTVEWSLGDQFKVMVFESHGGGGNSYSGGSQFNLYKKVDLKDGILYANQYAWRTLGIQQKPWPYTGFFSSSLPIESFDCVKGNFLGQGGTIENPQALKRSLCTNTSFWSINEFPWGVLHNRLTLAPRGEQKLALTLGMVRKKGEVAALAEKYADLHTVENERQRAKRSWDDLLKRSVNVETPEVEIDRIVNIWSKYQWRSSLTRGLNTGLPGLGFWSYALAGGSYNGSNLDVVLQPHDVTILKASLRNSLQLQYQAMDAGSLTENQPLMLYSDLDMNWPPQKTAGKPFPIPHSHETFKVFPLPMYIKEFGDLSVLDERIPFIDGKEGTVFEHMKLAVHYSLRGLGRRGLPLMIKGIGDWNDELNMVSRQGRGESVMLGMQLCYILREFVLVARAYDRSAEAEEWMQKYDYIKSAINQYAWDGEWYIRAFADGEDRPVPIGSSKNEEGKIYLNAQSWAVLSGVAEGTRARQCMQSVEKYLVTDYGPMLFAPAYSQFDEHVGTQSRYAPGWRNACIYPRPAGWAIIAACLADLPNLAFKMYKNTSLPHVSRNIERFQHEPYVYPENYVGPDHRLAGLAQFQWNLGEGTNWMWHSYVYYILGVRPELGGLLVDPKIPSDWQGFKLTRPFAGATYEIEVRNPYQENMGVRSMDVDGKTVEGNLIPFHRDGNKHTVKVVLGA